MKITINCHINTRGGTIKDATFPYQIPEHYFDRPFDTLTYQDIEELVFNMDKLDIVVLDFEPSTRFDVQMLKQYRISVLFEDSQYVGQFIFNDLHQDINLHEWQEWGQNAPFHDTILERILIDCDQPTSIQNIEYIGEYENFC
tara:strand:- start:58 stop:486 length:429 start_codon:yes stop_codon:yes gene_type:complete